MAHVRSYAPARPCEYCGTSYAPRLDQLKPGRGRFCSQACCNASRTTPLPAMEELLRLYVGEKQTVRQVAQKVGTSQRKVADALRAAGVLRRSGWRPTTGYSTRSRGGRQERVHRALAQEHGLLAPGQVVHHINVDPSDNRLENLAGLSRSEHAAAHKQLQTLAGQLVTAGLIKWHGSSYAFSCELERLLKRA